MPATTQVATPVVCAVCHSALADAPQGPSCTACGAQFILDDGFPVLMVPGEARFADDADCCAFAGEEETNRFTTTNYYLPLIAQRFPGRRDLRVLSAGCGIGADVDSFHDAGIAAWGVDCGARTMAWAHRSNPNAFQIGSVLNLPYADESFDLIVTGCLLPHIGVQGDSTEVVPDHAAQRARVASELLRVLRPGGLIVTGNPNRRCPVDLFHKGQMRQGGLMRWHAPDENFLLSFADYGQLFAAAQVETLPPARYWGFHTKRRDPKMWVLVGALRGWFALLSLPGLGFLRATGLNPWLMVGVGKPE
jgi:SAM-dependent methyltransferase